MDSKRLDLNLLVTLEALLVEQNVTKAAARLHLSQPAVSAQLSRLRDVFDDPLLIPAQRGMTPTAKAIELLDPLRQALDQVRATVATHRNFDPAKAKLTVTIACTDYLQAAVVKPLVVELRTTGARRARGAAQSGHAAAGSADGARRCRPGAHDAASRAAQSSHPASVRRALCAHRPPQSSATAQGITVEEFAQLEHVIVSLRGGDFVTPVDDALAALGHSRNVVLSAASFLFVPEIVSQSDFVALVPERLVRDRADKLEGD